MDKIFRLHSYYFPPEITNKILFEHKGLCHPTAKIIKEEVNIFKQNILNILYFLWIFIKKEYF